jgi:hypothetical protein
MLAAFARRQPILLEAIAAHGGYAYKQIGNASRRPPPAPPHSLPGRPWPPSRGRRGCPGACA